MEQSYQGLQSTNGRRLLLNYLQDKQNSLEEGSKAWHDLDAKINQIVAENLLRYLNGERSV